jgi:hypothetical protein
MVLLVVLQVRLPGVMNELLLVQGGRLEVAHIQLPARPMRAAALRVRPLLANFRLGVLGCIHGRGSVGRSSSAIYTCSGRRSGSGDPINMRRASAALLWCLLLRDIRVTPRLLIAVGLRPHLPFLGGAFVTDGDVRTVARPRNGRG